MNWFGRILQRYIDCNDTVLDIGCGIMQATEDINSKIVLGCDVWELYLHKIKDKYPTIKLGCNETYKFIDSSYDVVICLDVIEHLTIDLAIKMLEECKRICRKKAIVFTPYNFQENEQPEGGAWNMGENPYQKHQCVVPRETMERMGYNCIMLSDSTFGVYEKWE